MSHFDNSPRLPDADRTLGHIYPPPPLRCCYPTSVHAVIADSMREQIRASPRNIIRSTSPEGLMNASLGSSCWYRTGLGSRHIGQPRPHILSHALEKVTFESQAVT